MLLAGVLAAAAIGGALSVASCVGDGGTDTYNCPNRTVFTGQSSDGGVAIASVSGFLERRCGTLDCHGSEFRPLRLYGRYGLRFPGESNFSGGVATTTAELRANYASVCTQEPEKTSAAVEDLGQSAEQLLILRKARGEEAHKGGAVVKQNSAGDQCIAGWLRGDDPAQVATACKSAIDALP